MPKHLAAPKDVLLLTCSTQNRRSIYYGGLTARVVELKRIATFDANQFSDGSRMHTAKRILPEIATLEYCCNVHDIFDQLFMATAERITLERVLDIEKFVMLRLKYLVKCETRNCSDERKQQMPPSLLLQR